MGKAATASVRAGLLLERLLLGLVLLVLLLERGKLRLLLRAIFGRLGLLGLALLGVGQVLRELVELGLERLHLLGDLVRALRLARAPPARVVEKVSW